MRLLRQLAALLVLASSPATLRGERAPAVTPAPLPKTVDRSAEPMVEIARACPTIFIELRYATERNVTGKPLYPANARCLLRESVAARLARAQERLRSQGLSLKIWDAYRPAWVQYFLWEAVKNPDFVGEPARGGSLHTYGAAVDVTLVDLLGRGVKMPTDFDDFTPAAKRDYRGGDRAIAANLQALQSAMASAGFRGMRDEWWHFAAENVREFRPIEVPLGPNLSAP